MIYIAALAHEASVKDDVGIYYECISKNGITHATVIILNIKFYLFPTVLLLPSLSKFFVKVKHDIFHMAICQCAHFLILFKDTDLSFTLLSYIVIIRTSFDVNLTQARDFLEERKREPQLTTFSIRWP